MRKRIFVVLVTLFSVAKMAYSQSSRISAYVKPLLGAEIHYTKYHPKYTDLHSSTDSWKATFEWINHTQGFVTQGIEMGLSWSGIKAGFIYRHGKSDINYTDPPDNARLGHVWEVAGVVQAGGSGRLFRSPVAVGFYTYLSVGHYLYKGIQPMEIIDGNPTGAKPLHWSIWGGEWGLEPEIGLKFNRMAVMLKLQGGLMLTRRTYGIMIRFGPSLSVQI